MDDAESAPPVVLGAHECARCWTGQLSLDDPSVVATVSGFTTLAYKRKPFWWVDVTDDLRADPVWALKGQEKIADADFITDSDMHCVEHLFLQFRV
jgi:hypothetical protein